MGMTYHIQDSGVNTFQPPCHLFHIELTNDQIRVATLLHPSSAKSQPAKRRWKILRDIPGRLKTPDPKLKSIFDTDHNYSRVMAKQVDIQGSFHACSPHERTKASQNGTTSIKSRFQLARASFDNGVALSVSLVGLV